MKTYHSCLHPIKTFNKYVGKEVVASCGKCAYCRCMRAIKLTNRIDREFVRLGDSTALFLTLTYNNDSLPIYVYDGRAKRWRSNRESKFPRFGYLKAEEVNTYAHPVGVECYGKDGRKRTKRRVFAHLCYPDVQMYFSRVRTEINTSISRGYDDDLHRAYGPDLKYETLKIRYFVCGEYGPVTFRPHYHCVIWLNHRASEEQIKALAEILSSSWKNGNVDIETVTTGGVSSYLASYVNGASDIPKVLENNRHLRPFAHYSRDPVAGTKLLDEDEVKKVLTTGDACTRRYDPKEGKLVIEEFPDSTKRRYFPQCDGFSYKDTSELLYVYSYVYRYFKSRGIEHSPEEADSLRYFDIPFPIKLLSEYASNGYKGYVYKYKVYI